MPDNIRLLQTMPFRQLDKWYVEYYLNTKKLNSKFNVQKLSTLITPVKRRIKKADYDGILPVVSKIKTNYPVTPRQKRSRCRSNRGIIDSPTPLFTPFCRFRYRSRGQIHSHQYPRTSSTNDPFLKWFSYASRMMRIAMSTSPF